MDKTQNEIGSYSEGTGKHNKEYDELYEKLVPDAGEAPTVRGELLRCVSRLGYEYWNNGNCNAVECQFGSSGSYLDEEDGYEEDEEEFEYAEWTSYYGDMFEYINKHAPSCKKTADKLYDMIIDTAKYSHYNYKYTDNDPIELLYNKLIHEVMEVVLKLENE